MTRLCASQLCRKPIPDSMIARAKYCCDACRRIGFKLKDRGDLMCKVCGKPVAYSMRYCTETCHDLDKDRGKHKFNCKRCGVESTSRYSGAKFCGRKCRISYAKENTCEANKYQYNCELCGKLCFASNSKARLCRGNECRRVYERKWKKMRRDGISPERLDTDGRVVWKDNQQAIFKDVKLKIILAPLN